MTEPRQISTTSRRLAELLDSKFRLPGTRIRFGLDTILGLLPVAGDTITLALGAVIVREAVTLRARPTVILRMLANLALDWLVGLVPLVDIVFDTLYKANQKNLALLEREVSENHQ